MPDQSPEPAHTFPLLRLGRRQLTFAALGFCMGLADLLLFRLAGIQMHLGQHDATLLVLGFFSLTFAAIGIIIARLLDARDSLARNALMLTHSARLLRENDQIMHEQLEALHVSRQRILQAEKLAAIGQLAAGVAHEVRNPLGVIRAAAALVREDLPVEGASHRAAGFICDEVDRLNALVTALLDYSRPLTPTLRPHALHALARSALELVERSLEGPARQLEVHIDEALIAPLDPDLLTQALHDLLLNAVQAGSPGGRVEARGGADSSGVWLEVADDGPGIASELLDKVTEPFFTTRAGGSGSARGSGLGLAMVARIVEAHGGALEFRQHHGLGPEGLGACVRLTLPDRLGTELQPPTPHEVLSSQSRSEGAPV